MTYEEFKRVVYLLYENGNLDFHNLELNSGYESIHMIQYLKNYIDYLFNTKKDYESLVIILPAILEGLELHDSINNYRPYLYELYSEMQYRSRENKNVSDSKKNIKRLRLCRNIIKAFMNRIEVDTQVLEKTEEAKKFDYIWHVLTVIRDPEFYRLLTKRQCFYVNINDASYNSIFYRLVLEYLENYDEYYLRVLPIILESPYFLLETEELEKIYNEINKHYEFKLNNKQLIDRLKNLLNHYFNFDNYTLKYKNRMSYINGEMSHNIVLTPIVLDRIDTMDRVNLTNLSTFSINSSAKTKKDLNMKTTIAYSVLETSDGYELYYHVPDLPEYIKDNSPENERASYIIEEIKYRHRILPLFNRDTLCNTTNLLPNFDRMAITFRVKLDHKFRTTKIEIFKSTIKNDRVINIQSSAKDKEFKLLAHITENLTPINGTGTAKDESIYQSLSDFLHRELTLLNNGELPFIYKNLISHENMSDVLKYSRLTEFTNKIWSTNVAKQYLSVYHNRSLDITIYTTVPMLTIPNTIVRARVTDPHSSYIALENLRMLKDLVIDKKSIKREWRERALLDSFIVNSTNQEILVEDPDVKRLLLTRNNCGKINL